MKNSLFVIILFFSGTMFAQKNSHTEVIKKELQFKQKSADNILNVHNVNGSITVEGYNGNTILVEVEKTISGRTTSKLEQGKEEVELGIHEEGNEILLYTQTPCTEVKYKKRKNDRWFWQTWKNNCNWGNGVHFHFNYKIKVPYNSNIVVSTVNDGDIKVTDVRGIVDANNVNGSITLQKIEGKTHAHTINGDLDVVYTKNPTQDSRYYSLNGDINAFYQKGLSAQLAFESFNGEFFTNLGNIEMLPEIVEKKKKGKGIKYKIGGKSKMQVGSGNVLLDFETFNGNVYVKEN